MPPTVQMIFSDIGDEIYHGAGLLRGAAHGCAAGVDANPCREAFVLHGWGMRTQGSHTH